MRMMPVGTGKVNYRRVARYLQRRAERYLADTTDIELVLSVAFRLDNHNLLCLQRNREDSEPREKDMFLHFRLILRVLFELMLRR